MKKQERNDGIAIVDDERELVRLYEIFFKEGGCPICYVAYNGQEAIDMFKMSNDRPKMIIMDQCMPVKTGIEATREILAIDPGVKIIFISADEHMRGESLRAGAVAFILKPVSISKIIDCVEAILCRQDDLKA
jgi:two-component system, chemotaxis family, chemotaxis protein CheY